MIGAIALLALFLALRPAPANGPQTRASEWALARDGAVREFTVREGDTLTLRITTDRKVLLHIHGYDLKRELVPRETAVLSFAATLSGRFEIEDELTERTLGVLVVEPR